MGSRSLPERLEDERVRLRAPTPADVDWVFDALRGAEDVARWTRIPWPYERVHAEQWIRSSADGRARGTDIGMLVEDALTGERAGSAGLHRLGTAPNAGSLVPDEVGYWLAPAARGKGLATAAVRLLARCALVDVGRPEVALQVLDGNDASRRVAERAGFRYLGTWIPPDDPDDPCARGIPMHRYTLAARDLPT